MNLPRLDDIDPTPQPASEGMPTMTNGLQRRKPNVALSSDQVDGDRALALAARLGIPLADQAVEPPEFLLCLSSDGLDLRLNATDAPGAVRADFVSARVQQRLHQSDLLARAVGLPRLKAPSVIDATAGLGRDGWALAQRGCAVVMIERSVFIHALLEDALLRAHHTPSTAAACARVTLHLGEATTYLDDPTQPADVIYLDPMFPDRRKTALVKKEMRLFQHLLGHDEDAGKVLRLARERARYRVVVKRPLHGEALDDEPPTFQLTARSTRFDIYVNRGLP